MATKVSIVKCADYEQAHVDEAVRQSLALIGGLEKIVKPGNKVLLKVNALMGAGPDGSVTTHPAVVTAVIKAVKQCGGIPIVGDSPGNALASVNKVLRDTGIAQAAEAAGAQVVNFQEGGTVDVPSPSRNKRIPTLKICKIVLDADVIINLPKLKTHNFTLYTGAVKNMFGSVPGFHKSNYHIIASRPHHFAESIVDILEVTKPKLNILDAVMGMEGHGPAGGKSRFMGAIMASTDAVAIDAVGSAAIGYDPNEIVTTKEAIKRGLGEGQLDRIEILGTPLSEIQQKDWEHSTDVHRITRYVPEFLYALVRPIAKYVRIDPIINQEKCTKCLVCVKNCPAKTMYFRNGRVEIDLSRCIMCFCCHELCEYDAIRLKRSWLAKKLGIGSPDYDD